MRPARIRAPIMKRVILSYLAIAAIVVSAAFTSCGGGSGSSGGGGGKGNIIMKGETDKMSFSLAGEGNVTIDWGDGVRETHEIGNNSSFSHEYTGTSVRTVAISGKNITKLNCRSGLTSLDVSKCTTLTMLDCGHNQLTSLDVSKCTALTKLDCEYNQLTSLDVSKCTALTELDCRNNQLTTAALNALFGTLHSNAGEKTIIIWNNPGANDCDHSIAERKGWTVRRR